MPKLGPDLWRIGLIAPLKHLAMFETALEPFADAMTSFLADPDADEREEDVLWRLEAYSRSAVDKSAIDAALALGAAALGVSPPPADVARIADEDWVASNMRSFPPIDAGRFFVHGSHYEGEIPPSRIGLQIDAGSAFGSGEHATTMGCLLALDGLLKQRRFAHALDLGCGSGILAIGLAKAGRPVKVLAADIDRMAVAVARRNARVNQVASSVRTCPSPGYASVRVKQGAPYDIVLANILARPLMSMAAKLAQHLAPGGIAVLSGLLVRQERMVLSAHRMQGLALKRRIRINGWSALVLTKAAQRKA